MNGATHKEDGPPFKKDGEKKGKKKKVAVKKKPAKKTKPK
jgi:hypothetical protein